MFRLLCWILFKLQGWKVDYNLPENMQPCVMTAAPHTSNWDIIYMTATFNILKIPFRFTIKKEWMFFPFTLVFGPIGGIAIDRSPKKPGEKRRSMVDAMTDLFKDHPKLIVVVTPEGTRSLRTEWKTGFYHVARNAGVPICLGFLDYDRKVSGVGPAIMPTDDMAADMRKINEFYSKIAPKIPEKFGLDSKYAPNSDNE